jgi:hypothetical protein
MPQTIKIREQRKGHRKVKQKNRFEERKGSKQTKTRHMYSGQYTEKRRKRKGE